MSESSPHPRRIRPTRSLGWAAAIAAFAWVQWLRWPEPPGLDQSLFACFGLWIPRGLVPYVDLWDSKPPGLYYIYAFALWLLGPAETTVRLLDGAATLAGGVAVYALGRATGLTRGPWGLLAYVLFAQAPLFGGFWGSAQAESLIAPLSAAALVASLGARPGVYRARAWTAGALAGLVTTLKLPGLVCLIPALAGVPLGAGRRTVPWLLLGLLAVPAMAAVALYRGDALQPLAAMLLDYTPAYLGAVTPADSWAAALKALAKVLTASGVVSLLAALGCLQLLSFWRAAGPCRGDRSLRGAVGRRPAVAAVVAWAVFSAMAVGVQRQFAPYHFIVLLGPAALLAGVGCETLGDALRSTSRAGRAAAAAGIVLLAVLAWRDTGQLARFYAPQLQYQTGRIDRDRFLDSFDRGMTRPRLNRRVADYVRQSTSPDETLLVWGLAPDVYYYSRRRPATRFLFHHVLLTDAPLSRRVHGLAERQTELLQSMARVPPALVLVGLRDANAFEPRSSDEQLRRFPRLHRLILRDYAPDRVIGQFLILRRRRPGTVPPDGPAGPTSGLVSPRPSRYTSTADGGCR